MFVFFFKQKTAYEMRISDWSSDVCSSDLPILSRRQDRQVPHALELPRVCDAARRDSVPRRRLAQQSRPRRAGLMRYRLLGKSGLRVSQVALGTMPFGTAADWRSEEHTPDIQSLMRISYAVFCLQQKN